MTETIFRKYKNGEVIAIFPYNISSSINICVGYTLTEKHHDIDFESIIERTVRAGVIERKTLLDELKSIGYKIKPIKEVDYERLYREWVNVANGL